MAKTKEMRITVRMSKSEYDRLLSLAEGDPDCNMKKSGKPSLSSYIRKCVFYSGDHPENLKAEIRSLDYQIRKAGVNINQAVHRINAGIGGRSDLETLLANQEEILNILSKIHTLLEQSASGR